MPVTVVEKRRKVSAWL